jgi:hypothetical protein
MINTVAGMGAHGRTGDGGPAAEAAIGVVQSLAIYRGDLYFTDVYNHCVRKVSADGTISTVAGGTFGYGGDGSWAVSAKFRFPHGIAVDPAGRILIADSGNNRVRMVDLDGRIYTVAGTGVAGFSGDGGAAVDAQLNYPYPVVVDSSGGMLIADLRNYRVRTASLTTAYDQPGDLAVGDSLGIGTGDPQRAVHIQGSNAVLRMDRSQNSAAFMLVRTGGPGTVLKSYVVGVDASASNQGRFIINDLGSAVGGAGSNRMTIDNSGNTVFGQNVTSRGFFSRSSVRVKSSISQLEDSLNGLLQLQGVRYRSKDGGGRSVGLIAEDVNPFFPEVVLRRAEGNILGLDYNRLVPLLVEGVKSQQERIEALKIKRKRLERLLEELRLFSSGARP